MIGLAGVGVHTYWYDMAVYREVIERELELFFICMMPQKQNGSLSTSLSEI